MTAAYSRAAFRNRLGMTSNQLETFCDRWQIAELALFGSILCDDFNLDSDIDIQAIYQPQAQHGLFEKVIMKEELETWVNRKVDLVSKKASKKAATGFAAKVFLIHLKLFMSRDLAALLDTLKIKTKP